MIVRGRRACGHRAIFSSGPAEVERLAEAGLRERGRVGAIGLERARGENSRRPRAPQRAASSMTETSFVKRSMSYICASTVVSTVPEEAAIATSALGFGVQHTGARRPRFSFPRRPRLPTHPRFPIVPQRRPPRPGRPRRASEAPGGAPRSRVPPLAVPPAPPALAPPTPPEAPPLPAAPCPASAPPAVPVPCVAGAPPLLEQAANASTSSDTGAYPFIACPMMVPPRGLSPQKGRHRIDECFGLLEERLVAALLEQAQRRRGQRRRDGLPQRPRHDVVVAADARSASARAASARGRPRPIRAASSPGCASAPRKASQSRPRRHLVAARRSRRHKSAAVSCAREHGGGGRRAPGGRRRRGSRRAAASQLRRGVLPEIERLALRLQRDHVTRRRRTPLTRMSRARRSPGAGARTRTRARRSRSGRGSATRSTSSSPSARPRGPPRARRTSNPRRRPSSACFRARRRTRVRARASSAVGIWRS